MTEFSPIPTENVRTVIGLCEPVTIPICVGKDGLFGHQAMGLLFAIADAHFLITCRHAVHDVVARGAGLWVPDDINKEKAIALTPKFFFFGSDLLDLAVMKLPDDFVSIFSNHRFSRAIDTHTSAQPEGIPCVMYGILATESETWRSNVSPNEQKLRTSVFVGRTTTIKSDSEYINDGLHFLISADNLITGTNSDGEKHEPPISFQGLSGTPVFAVNGDPYKPNWHAHDYKIIGIQSSVVYLPHEKRVVMKVMRIECMYYLIEQVFPSVAETLKKLKPVTAISISKRIITP